MSQLLTMDEPKWNCCVYANANTHSEYHIENILHPFWALIQVFTQTLTVNIPLLLIAGHKSLTCNNNNKINQNNVKFFDFLF